MDRALLRSITPYLIGLIIAIALYIYAGTIVYTARTGELGPEVWPRMAIALMGASCLFEISRRLIAGNKDAEGFLEAFDQEPAEKESTPVHASKVIGGIALMAVYAVAVQCLGFIFATFLFLAIFMYVGGYRAHGVIWGASAVVTIFCGILFLRIAYVSLPRGIEPFDRITDAFFMIPGL